MSGFDIPDHSPAYRAACAIKWTARKPGRTCLSSTANV